MEFVPQLMETLWSLKNMYDQHGANKNEIARLKNFIEDYDRRIPQLLAGFKQIGVSGTSEEDLKKLRLVIMDATKKLNGWATDRNFFRVLSADQRMQELEHLQSDVMAHTEKVVWFVTLEMVMELREGHNKILARLPEARPQPVQSRADQASSQVPTPVSNILKTVKHSVLNADHQLAAGEQGEVYVIVKDPRTTRSSVWMRTGQSDFVRCGDVQPAFRSTSPPMRSGSGKLYVGGMILSPSERPAVMVWNGRHFMCSLQTPKAHAIAGWEYTFLAQSCTGAVLYCGCSDGTIETWNHVAPDQPRSCSGALRGHLGAIKTLAVQKNGILLSVDAEKSNIVRVWRNLKQVAFGQWPNMDHHPFLDLKHEKVRRMACSWERNVYVVTEGGSTLWCDLENVLQGHYPPNNAAGSHFPVFGVEIFSLLPRPSSGSTSASIALSCLVVEGTPETVCFVSTTLENQGAYCIEKWHGKNFVFRVETGLQAFQSWTVSKNGTVYISSRSTGEIYHWKLSKSNLQRNF